MQAHAYLAGCSQAILLFPQLLAGSVQALFAQLMALQLLLHLLLGLSLPLLKLPNTRQELLVAVNLTLWRRKIMARES